MASKVFIIDVDGVMTTGNFIYNEDGKYLKIFGPDDNDALKFIKDYLEIQFITADKRGFKISKKRIVEDMGFELHLVGSSERLNWIKDRYDLNNVIFMGDGIFDFLVMKKVSYSISPSNAYEITKSKADYVTRNSGGNRAVAEACLHILSKFFNQYDIEKLIEKKFIKKDE